MNHPVAGIFANSEYWLFKSLTVVYHRGVLALKYLGERNGNSTEIGGEWGRTFLVWGATAVWACSNLADDVIADFWLANVSHSGYLMDENLQSRLCYREYNDAYGTISNERIHAFDSNLPQESWKSSPIYVDGSTYFKLPIAESWRAGSQLTVSCKWPDYHMGSPCYNEPIALLGVFCIRNSNAVELFPQILAAYSFPRRAHVNLVFGPVPDIDSVIVSITRRNKWENPICMDKPYSAEVTCQIMGGSIESFSPVDLCLIGENSMSFCKIDSSSSLLYSEWKDDTGNWHDRISWTSLTPGIWKVKVIPDSTATPDSTFSLYFWIPTDSFYIVQDMSIADIPEDGFAFYPDPYASLSGFVIADSSDGLLGVNVDIYDSLGTLWQSVATDDSGFYHIDSIPNGDYSVTVTTPIGYQTDQETKEFTIHHIPVSVDFNLNKLDITPRQRSRAYWAHQLCRALRNRPKHYTKGDFSGFGNLIGQHFNGNVINPVQVYVVPQPATQKDSLNVLKKLLTFRRLEEGEPFLKRIARAQLVALMLNVVSGKISQTEPITGDSMNVSQAITYCDMLIYDLDCPVGNVPDWFLPGFPNRDELIRYVKASFVAGLINVGVTLPAGSIPPDIDDIAYKYVAGKTPVPDDYSLSQNYPNPFNATTEIKYALPDDCWVKLEVYDILGRRVTSLVKGWQEAGYKSVRWDASRVASGIYFYRLQSGGFVQTRKMILIR